MASEEQLIDISDSTTGNVPTTNQDDVEKLKSELQETKEKLNDALSEVAVAGILQENLCSMERQKVSLEEELATMQILLSEATNDSQSNVIDHLKKKYYEMKAENQDLRIQLNLIETGLASGGGGSPVHQQTASVSSSSSAGVKKHYSDAESLLGVTKTLAKRVKSSVQTVIPAHAQSSNNDKEDVDDSMARAREGAETLREIVLPLEEQIVALKGKLRETDSLLQEYEKRQACSLLEMEAVGSWLVGGDKKQVEDKLIEEVGDGYSGGEGELFHAMLAARIGILVQELDMVKWERDELRGELETERKTSSGLKDNVERMQSVVAVNREQLTRVRSQLTDQQKEQLGASWNQENVQEKECVKEKVISQSEWERLLARLDNKMQEVETQTECGDESGDREELKKITLERDHLKDNCSKYQEDLKSEAVFRKEMESTWNQRGEEYKEAISIIEEKLRNAEFAVSKMNSSYLALTEASRRDLHTLTKDREKIVKELRRLQSENDNLVGKHSLLSEQMASEVINLPDSMEDMQLLLLTYREDLIAAKLGKERAEEKVKTDVRLLKDHLVKEQQVRMAMEKQLRGEILDLKSKASTLEDIRIELAGEKDQRRMLEDNVNRLEALQAVNSKKSEAVAAAAITDKEELAVEVATLRKKVVSLQMDLDNSVAVQNDFVRLSQSLQVELEKIRQQEKEVRWQHEEDVDDCNTCRQGFSVTRRKHHCRHCGRIFCTDCVSKQVSSGPAGRVSRVCDVCHTLLSHHSAPYFSLEAPALPE